jgi:hypothetical protein
VPLEQLDGAFSLSFSIKNLLALPDFEELFDLFEGLEGMQVGDAGQEWPAGRTGRPACSLPEQLRSWGLTCLVALLLPRGLPACCVQLAEAVGPSAAPASGSHAGAAAPALGTGCARLGSCCRPGFAPASGHTRGLATSSPLSLPPTGRGAQIRIVMGNVSSAKEVALLLSAFSIPTKIKPKKVRPLPPSPLLPRGEAAAAAAGGGSSG